MRLITKELVNQAVLVDPARHDGMILSARLHTRRGSYGFTGIERVKGGIAFSVPESGELVMLDEEELVGLSVEPGAGLRTTKGCDTLPKLLAWAEEQQTKNASARKRAA